MSDRWVDRLSEYLDGELPPGELVALEAHLATCAECSAVLADLRRVVSRARAVEARAPHQDLWPGIARRIGATTPRTRVWSFSLPQLAAAGIALMALSGSAVWMLKSSDSAPATRPVTSAQPTVMPTIIDADRSASKSYAAAVADLERILASGRERLDTTTIRVIEQNLATIDKAIVQAQRALETDPANLYLNSHLVGTMRRKLDLLRHAAALVPVS